MRSFFRKFLIVLGSVLWCSTGYASTMVSNDLVWQLSGPCLGDAPVSFTLEEENSASADFNSFGVFYTTNYRLPNPGTFETVEVFSGSDVAGTEKLFSSSAIAAPNPLEDIRHGIFGFYIDTPNGIFTSTKKWFSYQTDLFGENNEDIMQTYHTETDGSLYTYRDDYTLHFEDTQDGEEYDFNDMIVRVNGMQPSIFNGIPSQFSTTPVPVPSAAFLLLGGLPFVFKKRKCCHSHIRQCKKMTRRSTFPGNTEYISTDDLNAA